MKNKMKSKIKCKMKSICSLILAIFMLLSNSSTSFATSKNVNSSIMFEESNKINSRSLEKSNKIDVTRLASNMLDGQLKMVSSATSSPEERTKTEATTNVIVKKEWEDGKEGKKAIEFYVLKNGEKLLDENNEPIKYVLSEENNREESLDLPKIADNEEYTVEEDPVPEGYTASYSFKEEEKDIKGYNYILSLNMENKQDIESKDEITIKYKIGEDSEEYTLKIPKDHEKYEMGKDYELTEYPIENLAKDEDGNPQEFTFVSLDGIDADDKDLKATVNLKKYEEAVIGKETIKTITITNKLSEIDNKEEEIDKSENSKEIESEISENSTLALKTSSLVVEKNWSDQEAEHEPVEVELMHTGTDGVKTPTGDKIILNKDNGWKGVFNGLEVPEDGKSFAYSVRENNVPTGYTPSYGEIKIQAGTPATGDYWVPSSDEELQTGKTYVFRVEGQSFALSHNPEKNLIRDQVTVHTGPFTPDGQVVDDYLSDVDPSSPWTVTYKKQDKGDGFIFYNANGGTFYIKGETCVENESDAKVNQYLTNGYIFYVESAKTFLHWSEHDQRFYLREDKDEYKDKLEKFKLYERGTVPDTYKTVITNSKSSEATSPFLVKKEWTDGSEGKSSIGFYVLKNGVRLGKEYTLNEQNNWQITLDLPTSGNHEEYTVEEVPVDNYTCSYKRINGSTGETNKYNISLYVADKDFDSKEWIEITCHFEGQPKKVIFINENEHGMFSKEKWHDITVYINDCFAKSVPANEDGTPRKIILDRIRVKDHEEKDYEGVKLKAELDTSAKSTSNELITASLNENKTYNYDIYLILGDEDFESKNWVEITCHFDSLPKETIRIEEHASFGKETYTNINEYIKKYCEGFGNNVPAYDDGTPREIILDDIKVNDKKEEHYKGVELKAYTRFECLTSGMIIINTPKEPEKTSPLVVQKVWEDGNIRKDPKPGNVGKDPITFKLYKNKGKANEEVIGSYTLEEKNNWTKIFDDLLTSGNYEEYTVEEITAIEGYETTVDKVKGGYKYILNLAMQGGDQIEDKEDAYILYKVGNHGEDEFFVPRGHEKYEKDRSYTLSNYPLYLPLGENGAEQVINFTRVEASDADWQVDIKAEASINDKELLDWTFITITNSKPSEATKSLEVKKEWAKDSEKIVPIQFNLWKNKGQAGEELIGEYKLNSENSWKMSFDNLSTAGNFEEYSVEEVPVPDGYTVSYSRSEEPEISETYSYKLLLDIKGDDIEAHKEDATIYYMLGEDSDDPKDWQTLYIPKDGGHPKYDVHAGIIYDITEDLDADSKAKIKNIPAGPDGKPLKFYFKKLDSNDADPGDLDGSMVDFVPISDSSSKKSKTTLTILNTPIPKETKALEVKKEWQDDSGNPADPDISSVDFYIIKDGKRLSDESGKEIVYTLKKSDGWKTSIDLPTSGSHEEYSLEEIPVSGYGASYKNGNSISAYNFEINLYNDRKEIKKDWQVKIVYTLGDDTEEKEFIDESRDVAIKKGSDYIFTIKDDIYPDSNGNPPKFKAVAIYTNKTSSAIDINNITLKNILPVEGPETSSVRVITNIPEKTKPLVVKKEWTDGSEGKEAIRFYVLKNGKKLLDENGEPIVHTLSKDNNWQISLDLPTIDKHDEYTVEELPVAGYNASYDRSEETITTGSKTYSYTFTITAGDEDLDTKDWLKVFYYFGDVRPPDDEMPYLDIAKGHTTYKKHHTYDLTKDIANIEAVKNVPVGPDGKYQEFHYVKTTGHDKDPDDVAKIAVDPTAVEDTSSVTEETKVTITITNKPGAQLPGTGGDGTQMLKFIGLTAILIGALGEYRRRRISAKN